MTQHAKPEPKGEPVTRCKVCTKKIRPGEDHLKIYHSGTYHTVCCASCAAKFEALPEHYAAGP